MEIIPNNIQNQVLETALRLLMQTQFLQSDLWERIASLARTSSHKYVAVAYLGTGATKLLPLGEGDVLVTDLRLLTVRTGIVNPFEVEQYLSQGVEVYSSSNLHTKVFVFDNKALVASSNISTNSKNNLTECGVLTDDLLTVRNIRGFITSLALEPVTPQYVKSLQKEYRRPSKIMGGLNEKKPITRLWIERMYPIELDENETRLEKVGLAAARQRLVSKRSYEVESIRYGVKSGLGKRASIGDLVIQLWEEENEIWVYPPSRIVHIRNYTRLKGAERKFVYFEMPKHPKRLAWKRFRAELKKIPGLQTFGSTTNIGREIKNPNAKQQILGLWNSHHRKL